MRAFSASGTYIVFFLLACVAAGMAGSAGCASMGMPTGGPRDSLPPVLVSVAPVDSSLRFEGKKVTFVFDEYIQLDNPQQVLISPTPKIVPDIRSHLRTLTVTIKDTLEPATTYSFDFGNAIRDINEQNPLRGFTYVFSTGNVLDSLELTGKVVLAESGNIDTTLMVVLHTSFEDSAVTRSPRYRAKLDGEGNFRFRFLPADTFALYAVKDESGRGLYLSKRNLFAFADSLVNTLAPPQDIVLYAYSEEEDRPVAGAPASPLSRPAVGRPAGPAQDRRLQVSMNLQEGMLDLLSDLEINFPAAPLRYFDSTKVVLADEQFAPVTGYRYIRDTGNKKITLDHTWIPNAQYHLIVDKDFAEDTSGRKLLKSDTLSFITRKETEYGLAKLRFTNIDLSRNPVLLFVQNDAIVHTHILRGREFSQRLFKPGEYELRILYDENGNGVWDPGEFYGQRRQPERVITLPKRYTVRANFDNEVDVTL